MDFITKLDFTNRQVRQAERTFANISGGTTFGVTFTALTKGPDLLNTGITYSINGVASTFSGTSASTTYTWYDNSMSLGELNLTAWTPLNSAITQNTGVIFTSNTTTIIDDNFVTLTYSGVSFDLVPIEMADLGGGYYTGTVYTDVLKYYSASTLDYTGRTIWVDVSGITRTERLIITNLGSGPGVLDVGIDANGFLVNNASDVKLKENIKTIDNALNKVINLRGVTFNWKDKNRGGDLTKIGFVAQEVENVVPELTYDDGTYKSVHYKDVTALLVEAIKELVNGDVEINVTKENLNTQTVVAEDNNIELNYNGNHQTSIGGGIVVLHAIAQNENAILATDNDGNFTTNTALIPKSLIIPEYTPTSGNDTNGIVGELTRDADYLYLKCSNNNWKRIKLEDF